VLALSILPSRNTWNSRSTAVEKRTHLRLRDKKCKRGLGIAAIRGSESRGTEMADV